MENNLSAEKIKEQAFVFYKSINFEKEELTQESKNFIKTEVKKNQLKGYFNLEVWWAGANQIFYDKRLYLVLFEYVVEFEIEKLNPTTKHEVYNLLLSVVIIKEAYQKAHLLIDYIEKTFRNDSINFAFTLGRKAELYRRLDKYNETIECNYIALEILNEIVDSEKKQKLFFSLNNTNALTYISQGEIKTAISLFENTLKDQIKQDYKRGIAMCCTNLGYAKKVQKKYKKALSYYLKAQKTWEIIGNTRKVDYLNITLARIYFLDENFTATEKHIKICKNLNNIDIKQKAVHLEFRLFLKKQKSNNKLDINKLEELTSKILNDIEKATSFEYKMEEYPYIAKAYEHLGKFQDAIEILNKRHNLYVKHVEEQKIESYKQIRESHEIQLQQKEIEQKELLLEQKERLNVKLKRVNDELEQFTSMASHDLKSPLRTILTICNLMKDDDISKEDLAEYLNLVEKDALKMNNLVDSLLKYSKIGYQNVEMENLSLNTLISGVIENLATEIKQKNAVINLEEMPEIIGNKILLQQLFQNLISNALKYNDTQKPEINISMSENILEISDNGIGIPANRISEVFKAFTRAHSASKYEGSGVGLATCKKVMDLHSGTISVSSEVGKGSVFKLKFS
ncbi:MAG: sensor histidine kinase [Chitinophagales bacterium]